MQRKADENATDGWSRRALAWIASPLGTAVVAVGWSQIIAWGTTLYCLGVIGGPVVAEMGWSRGLVYGGLTAGLLVSALISTPVGRLIDRRGARGVMTAGALANAAGLALLSQVSTPWAWLAVWALLGVAMRLTLYDAAFAGMVQVAPSRGRRAISYLTLFGGFASSVFWPIGHWLNGMVGWRGTLIAFAVINLVLTMPLNWWGLARREAAAPPPGDNGPGAAATAPAPTAALTGRARTLAMVLFGIVMSATAFIFGAMAVHLPGLLQATGLSAAAAVALASYKGFAQVAGRVWELVLGQRLSPLIVGRVAIGFLPLAFAVLLAGGASFITAFLFTTAFGIANGLVTIVRGAVPLHLFGATGYGTVLGILATPYLVLNAVAPLVFAVVLDAAGYRVGEWLLLVVALFAVAALEVLIGWHRRLMTGAPNRDTG